MEALVASPTPERDRDTQMVQYMPELALIIAAYALGCVSTGYYLVKALTGDDIRAAGSGNIGARNVARVLGRRWMTFTLAGDALKGAVVVAVGQYLTFDAWAVIGVAMAVVAGHVWPVQLGFRGGKGLATAMGAVAVIDIRLVVIAFMVGAIGTVAWRNSTAGGLLAVALTPLVALILGNGTLTVVGLAVLAVALMATHRDNLAVILANVRQRVAGEN